MLTVWKLISFRHDPGKEISSIQIQIHSRYNPDIAFNNVNPDNKSEFYSSANILFVDALYFRLCDQTENKFFSFPTVKT